MKRILAVISLVLLSLPLYAGDSGIGASFGSNGTSYSWSGSSAKASNNVLNLQVKGVFGLQDGWEIDPYLGYYSASQTSSPDGATVDGQKYSDGQVYSIFTLGLQANKAVVTNGDFKVLVGGAGDIEFGGNSKKATDSSSNQYDLSVFVIEAYVPLAVEYRVTPNIGLRLSNALASLYYESDAYKYSGSTMTVSYTNFTFLPSSLRFGAFYFF